MVRLKRTLDKTVPKPPSDEEHQVALKRVKRMSTGDEDTNEAKPLHVVGDTESDDHTPEQTNGASSTTKDDLPKQHGVQENASNTAIPNKETAPNTAHPYSAEWCGTHTRFPDDSSDNDDGPGSEPITDSNAKRPDEENHSEVTEEESYIETVLVSLTNYIEDLLRRTGELAARDDNLRVVCRDASTSERRKFREELLSIMEKQVLLMKRMDVELVNLENFHTRINELQTIKPNIEHIVQLHDNARTLFGKIHAQLISIQNSVSVKLCLFS